MSSHHINSDKFNLSLNSRGYNILSYITQTNSINTPSHGALFGIIENTSQGKADNEEPLMRIFKIIEYYYYHIYNEKSYTRDTAFEKTLKSANNEILRMIQKEELFLDLDNLSMLIGVIYPSETSQKFKLNICPFGDIKAYLAHKTQLDHYRLLDISGPPSENEEQNGFISLFSNVISGEINPGDTIFAVSSSILNYLSEDEIKSIISSNHPNNAKNQFQTLLGAFQENFAGIIISPGFTEQIIPSESKFQQARIGKEEGIPVQPQKPTLDDKLEEDSLLKLDKTGRDTKQILSPAIQIDFKRIMDSLWNISKNTIIKIIYHTKELSKKTTAKLKNTNNLNLKKISGLPKKIMNQKFNKKQYIPFEKNNKSFKRFTWKKLSKITSFVNKISPKSKTLILITLIIGLVFYYSIVWIGKRQENQRLAEQFRRISKTISTKQNQLEASLIYKEEEKAKKILDEISTLIEEMPKNTPERKDFKSTTEQSLEKFKTQIRHVVNISPKTIVDLEPFNPQMDLNNIVLLNGKLFTFDKSENSTYIIDPQKGDTAKLENTQITYPIKTIKKLNKELIVLDQENNFYRMDEDESFVKLESKSLNDISIDDFEFYNNKMYLLDSQKSQIYRFQISKTAISYEIAWVSANLNFNSARALSIDGSIHMVTDTSIISLRDGNLAENQISTSQIDPALKNGKKIYSNPDTNEILILEPARIIMLDNSGKVLAQYMNEELKDLKDFILEHSQRKIYILNKNKVMEFEIPEQEE